MKDATVQSISVGFDQRHSASTGESIMICVDRNSDISRGDIISAASHPVDAGDQFEARVLCLSEQPIVAGRSYLFNLHTCQALATISAIKYQIDVNSDTHLAACSLSQNDFGVINFSLDRRVPFDGYEHCRQLGSFLLIDRQNHSTLGAGMIHFGVHRVENLHWHKMDVDKEARARQKLQKPACLWFTGLPASGKSTIANILEKRLFAAGRHTYLLDGDNIRLGLNKDLGFSEADRSENIRRISEVARLLVDAGLVVMVSFISPFRAERDFARSLFEPREFLEIFVDAPLEECQRRDPKGLFAKARRGELKDLTGIDSRYEPPVSPEVHLDTTVESAEQCADRILLALEGMLLGEPDQLDQASDQDI
jgi:bifunctional enzyme CysN/CysC